MTHALLSTLKKAESFIAGFEDDPLQEGIPELLADLRAAITKLTPNPRLWSFLIAWDDNRAEEGEYGWAGEADTRDQALAAAYEEMFTDGGYVEIGEVFDLADFSYGRRVIEEWHGTNPWA